jgi:hypothetical protein
VVVDDGSGIDAERVVDGGEQFGRMHGVFGGGGAGLVGFAVDVAALDARAADDAGVAVGPVVAAVGAVAVAGGADAFLGAAAELADRDDQGFVEQAAASRSSKERAEALVEHGPLWFFMRSVRPTWWSQEWLSELATLGQMTSTTRVPASTGGGRAGSFGRRCCGHSGREVFGFALEGEGVAGTPEAMRLRAAVVFVEACPSVAFSMSGIWRR